MTIRTNGRYSQYRERRGGAATRGVFFTWSTIFTLAGALILTGCALLHPGDGGPGKIADNLPADSLLAIINRQALALGAAKGSGKLTMRTPDAPKGRRCDVSLVARRPDEVRIRGRVGILASIFDFAADSDSLTLYLPRDGVVSVRANRPDGAGLSMVASRELVEALLPPSLRLTPGMSGDHLARIGKNYEIRQLTPLGDGSVRERLSRYEPERLRLVEAVVSRVSPTDSLFEARVTYSAHTWTGASWFPGRIRLELAGEDRSLELAFDTFEPNPVIKPDTFHLVAPPGTRRVDPEDLNDDFLDDAPTAN